MSDLEKLDYILGVLRQVSHDSIDNDRLANALIYILDLKEQEMLEN